MMKRLKITGAMLITSMFVLANTFNVAAEGNVSLSADKESCEVGESVSVTVTAEADDGSAVPPAISIEYNPNRLSFDNCSTEYGGGGGGLITINDTSATIDFTTQSGGDAKISVSAVLGEDSPVPQNAELVISVNGEDIAAGTDEVGMTSTGVEQGTIDTGDGRSVQTVFADEFMPVLFHKGTVDYNGTIAECAQFDMGDMTLLYTTDASGMDGKFCIYNSYTGQLTDFRMIQGIENRFIIILDECEGEIPTGYTKAVLDWNGQTLTAYMNMNAASGSVVPFGGLNSSDFFLVYGLSSEGTKGWYQYDQSEGTYQRFVMYVDPSGEQLATGDEQSSEDSKGDAESIFAGIISGQVQGILIIVLAVLVLILIIVVIILAVKCAEYNDYEYVDPEDYYEDNERQEYKGGNGGMTAAAVVSKSFNDEDETESNDSEDSEGIDAVAENLGDNDGGDDTSEQGRYYPEDEESDEMIDDYFDPHMSRREMKAREKELRRQEKEAAREEKWRQKEEKRAAKMRSRGYEEASPMDWGAFGEDVSNQKDPRRPMGKSQMPSYMMDNEAADQDDNIDEMQDTNEVIQEDIPKTPARKMTPAMSAQREEESARALKEDELRKKQKRLFEQQQRIEEQRRIEQEQYEQEQRKKQEQFIENLHEEEELDEDFQFEFLNL